MSASLPNGSLIAIASGYNASKTMSALTNATEGVGTLEASHGVAVGEIVEITSGWSRLNGRIARAKTVATNDVTLESINTSTTTIYPTGSGTGSVREISGWTQIPQIVENNSAGGEQQFNEFQYLEDKNQRRIPTVKSAQGLDITIADDPTLACYPILEAADQDGLVRAIRITLPNGGFIYINAYVSFNKTPRLNVNEIMVVRASLSFVADITRYNS